MQYKDLEREAKGIGERNDCAVMAVTVISGRKYREVHAMFADEGRKNGRPTKSTITASVLESLGIIQCNVSDMFKARTVRTLEREMAPFRGCYLVSTRQHILAIKDGKVIDWTQGRLHRIMRVMRIHKLKSTKEERDGARETRNTL